MTRRAEVRRAALCLVAGAVGLSIPLLLARWLGSESAFFAVITTAFLALGTLAVVRETTRSKRLEERHRLLVEQMADGLFVADATGRYLDVNPAGCELFGMTREEILASSIHDLIVPEQAALLPKCLDPLPSHEVKRSEWRYRRKDGSTFDGEVSSRFLPDGRLQGILRDVTERKGAETALQRTAATLAAATDVAEVGTHQWDITHGRLWWDERVRDWWGVAPEAPVTYDTFIDAVHPEDRPRVQAMVHAALDPAGEGRFDATFRVALPGRPLRWVRSAGRVEFVDGKAATMFGAVLDVTRQREQEDALREMDRRKDQFLATLSHELRNPLAPIRSAAEMLAHEAVSTDQVTWAQRVIRRQATHMARLLDDLLDVARITRGKLELLREHVPLAALVDTALETARPAIEAKRHVLDVALPEEDLLLDVDPHRLAQALANLLTNAARYTEPGGHITLRAGRVGGGLAIAVRDTGVGIPAEALPTIFEMFSQVEGTARQRDGGLGIGLALVRGLVELHGGAVAVHSDGAGQGSEFTITLPRRALVPVPGTVVPRVDERDGAGHARVLVADDNRDAADSLGELLRIAGYDVCVTYGGKEALRSARLYRPDVMLVDLGMPDLSGYEVATALRAQPWAKSVRLVAVTGWGQESDRAQSLAAGFDAHLTKPVEFSGIRSLIARVAAGG